MSLPEAPPATYSSIISKSLHFPTGVRISPEEL